MLPFKSNTAASYFLRIGFTMIGCAIFFSYHAAGQEGPGAHLFEYKDGQESRWSSPENINGAKGSGGRENNGAKGHPYDSIAAGGSKELLNIQAQGIINRIWITINDRSAQMLRSLSIRMFWNNERTPAVSVPF